MHHCWARWRFPTANDFGSEIIPASAKEFFMKVCCKSVNFTSKSKYFVCLPVILTASNCGYTPRIEEMFKVYPFPEPEIPSSC